MLPSYLLSRNMGQNVPFHLNILFSGCLEKYCDLKIHDTLCQNRAYYFITDLLAASLISLPVTKLSLLFIGVFKNFPISVRY